MKLALLDSCVPLYALGAAHPRRDPSRQVLGLIARGAASGFASVELVQEVMFHRLRVTSDRGRALADGRDLAALLTLLPFDEDVLSISLQLIEQAPRLRGRDSVHVATAASHRISALVTYDSDFEQVPGIEVVTPDQFGRWCQA